MMRDCIAQNEENEIPAAFGQNRVHWFDEEYAQEAERAAAEANAESQRVPQMVSDEDARLARNQARMLLWLCPNCDEMPEEAVASSRCGHRSCTPCFRRWRRELAGTSTPQLTCQSCETQVNSRQEIVRLVLGE